MNDVTAIIVIKDNPPHLWEAIQSIENFATEIIVGTVTPDPAIVTRLKTNNKVRIIPLPDTIPYADMVKEDLKKQARGKYILYLDPDEIFPKEAIKTIEKKISDFAFFNFPRKNIIFNRWIKYSRWWPDYQLRFFKKDMVVWPKKIHPEPITRGVGYMLPIDDRFAIYHYNYDNIDQYFEKANRYAKSEAHSYIDKKINLTLPESVKKAVSEFISRFFACEGYHDGMHGFTLSTLQMFYYLLVYFYYWEAKKYEKVDDKVLIKSARDYFKTGAAETGFWIIQKRLTGKLEKWKIKIVVKLLKVFKL